MTALTLTIAGKAAPLLPLTAKTTGNTYWALNGQSQASRFGIKVPALASALPTSVVLEGVTVALKAGTSPSSGKANVSNHSIPLVIDGCAKKGKVVINDHGDGNWQVIAAVFGAGGGGGSAVNTNLFG